jgi:hypothetical protein
MTYEMKMRLTKKLMNAQPNDHTRIWNYAENGSKLQYIPTETIVHLGYKDGFYIAFSSNKKLPSFKLIDDRFVESNERKQILKSDDENDFFTKLANRQYMNELLNSDK